MSKCLGKDSWPELMGVCGREAAKTIEKENCLVNALIWGENQPTTKDFRCDRVFVFVNDSGIVTRVPMIY
ncbi:Proteinase inhibitor [Mizuhopecten yessoensis]|uniref:Proteinase inhibitor n=1 Tax=Mizuhopecten yessoensis TaxID=6573 RepID=A0A210PKN8_MIZYE|nr:Proteinase inhibitor [Mizuhopecten yessoensis]